MTHAYGSVPTPHEHLFAQPDLGCAPDSQGSLPERAPTMVAWQLHAGRPLSAHPVRAVGQVVYSAAGGLVGTMRTDNPPTLSAATGS